MPAYTCSVKICNNNSFRCKSVNFYPFPEDSRTRKKWIRFCKQSSDWELKNNSRICSEHFEETDFEPTMLEKLPGSTTKTRKILIPNCVPSLYTKKKPVEKVVGKDELDVPADPLSIFGGGMENIEFIIDDDDDMDSSTNKLVVGNQYTVEIAGQDNVEILSIEDLPDESAEEVSEIITVKEEIDIDEDELEEDTIQRNDMVPRIKVKDVQTMSVATNKDLLSKRVPTSKNVNSPDNLDNIKITNVQSLKRPYPKEISDSPIHTPVKTFPKVLPNILSKTTPTTAKTSQTTDPDKDIQVVSYTPAVSSAAASVTPNNSIKKDVKVLSAGKNPCYVPGCVLKKYETLVLFRVPSSPALFQLWDLCINRTDKRLGSGDMICQKHFDKNDIVKVKNSIATLPHEKLYLRNHALPCIEFHKKCVVPVCDEESGKMYPFPVLSKTDLQLWMYMVKNNVLSNLPMMELLKYRVCEKHFESNCFDSNGDMKKSAAPTMYLPITKYTGLEAVSKAPSTLPSKLMEPLLAEAEQCPSNKVCAFRVCQRTRFPKKLFLFPREADRCDAWLKATERMNLKGSNINETLTNIANNKYAVCDAHFISFDFKDSTMQELTPFAVPKKNANTQLEASEGFMLWQVDEGGASPTPQFQLTPTIGNVSEQDGQDDNEKTTQSATTRKRFIPKLCLYRNCTSMPTVSNPLYMFPADPERFQLWLDACGLKVKNAKGLGRPQICSKHFSSDMFEDQMLKPDAVPIPFDERNGAAPSENVPANNQSISSKGVVQQPLNDKYQCAVKGCICFYKKDGLGKHYRFPHPRNEEQRFKLWVRLTSNEVLEHLSPFEIYNRFMVCNRHFQQHFYTTSKELCLESVPTMNLPGDIKWLYNTDYFQLRVVKYLKRMEKKDEPDSVEWKEIENPLPTEHEKSTVVLGDDRLTFPALGNYLHMTKNSGSKRKFPYTVYKYMNNNTSSGYGMLSDVEYGQGIKIHTAIIIDDDDECEREVLQQLLDAKRAKAQQAASS